jgi:endonuclease/exonuclease/phosphatase family metal-dependent hydrolase
MKLILSLLMIMTVSNCSLWGQEVTESRKAVKVLSFNILHGATTRGDFDLDVIAKVITDSDPDFVALQEVDFKTNRAGKLDLATELGWRTKMIPLFAGAMAYDGGEYGEAILSKYSFVKTRKVALPYTMGNEPRAALEVISVLPSGDTIALVGTHLDHLKNETDRVAQAKKINEAFALNRYPTILAGDLNALPGSMPINLLEEVWSDSYEKTNPEPTFPSDKPQKKIDYVMFCPENSWRVLETRVICDSIASDHCALLVTLELVED